jgi:hypothetical protein
MPAKHWIALATRRGTLFSILVAMMLVETGSSQTPPDEVLPTNKTTIYGDKLTAPQHVYSVDLLPGSRLDVRLSGSSETVGLYDLSVYAAHDGLKNLTPSNCLKRAFAEPAPTKAPGAQSTPDRDGLESGCTPPPTSAPKLSKASLAKKGAIKARSPAGSHARISYLVAVPGIYYVVVQFYGVGIQLQMAASVTAAPE